MFNFTVEKGQGLVEYALIIILIALVVILAVSFFGTTLSNTFNFITNNIPNA
ncbi:MAG TPA: Flp family type IVb pilin [Anaerolineaceae bacterium]|jgi:pilus assembly protein Flp/PilA|nr:Flp family type IVb pilin [Chloroflexota bacterium]HNR00997.1 Flp family type IVb pilin [Anaerolineaceae bacterium]HNS06487.1 Flp family type IVb pilin [Anaerolineaceae bacterium]HNW14807.1 Flp family type IVb pilin [Anaerolineaceae bacterium]HOE03041.1 Flp family type IVb pilin [Anaerolineaceae bacterium]